jgi:D-alanine-D-alanine ligase
MKVAVVYNQPEPGKPDSEDVLDEVKLVTDALGNLGYEPRTFALGAEDRACVRFLHELGAYAPGAVFNLVENLGEDQRFYPIVASLFEIAGYPYTGSPFEALLTTTDKTLSKALLTSWGIPSPLWQQFRGEIEDITVPPPWIIKPAWEDASVGITDNSLFHDRNLLIAGLSKMYEDHQFQPILIEQFIEGREFNVSLVENEDGAVEALPLAEMVFHQWPEGKPRIVNYQAKWDRDSFEYRNTVRRFNPSDAPLDEIRHVALKCWEAFSLSGYARVDMRTDAQHEVYVIEVNTNPCVAPDAGFMAAAREAGYGTEEIIDKILKTALKKGKGAWKK